MGTVDPKMKRKRRTPPRKGKGGPAPLKEHKDWPEFCSLIINALKPFTDARDAVKEALRRKLGSEG